MRLYLEQQAEYKHREGRQKREQRSRGLVYDDQSVDRLTVAGGQKSMPASKHTQTHASHMYKKYITQQERQYAYPKQANKYTRKSKVKEQHRKLSKYTMKRVNRVDSEIQIA